MRSSSRKAFLKFRVDNLPAEERELVEFCLNRPPLKRDASDDACRNVVNAVIALKNQMADSPVGLAALRRQILQCGKRIFVGNPSQEDLKKIQLWVKDGSEPLSEVKLVLARVHVRQNFVWKVTGDFRDAKTRSLRDHVRRCAAPLVQNLLRKGIPHIILREGEIHPAESIGLLAINAFQQVISLDPNCPRVEFLPTRVITAMRREGFENSLGIRIPQHYARPFQSLIEAEQTAEPIDSLPCSEMSAVILRRVWDAIQTTQSLGPSSEPPALDCGQGDFSNEADQRSEKRKAIMAVVNSMSPRNRKIVTIRYGLGGIRPQSLKAVGEKFGLSPERVRQITIVKLFRLCKGPRGKPLRALLHIE